MTRQLSELENDRLNTSIEFTGYYKPENSIKMLEYLESSLLKKYCVVSESLNCSQSAIMNISLHISSWPHKNAIVISKSKPESDLNVSPKI